MVTIQNVPAMRLAGLVEKAPNITFHGPWKQIHAVAGEQGLMTPDSVFMAAFKSRALGGPQDMEFYAATLTVTATQTPAAPLVVFELPAGKYACYTHKGAYDGLGPAWGMFAAEIAKQGLTPDFSRLCTEIYRNDPRTTPTAELITELAVPLA